MFALIEQIKKSHSILLSTHRQCDGDGLGAEIGMFHALKKIGKAVRIVNVDTTPNKYSFLKFQDIISIYEDNPKMDLKCDLAIIFDTNDERMLTPMFQDLKIQAGAISFVDHHPILKVGPTPSAASYIDIKAASTGEMTFQLIKALEIPLDVDIARSIYTSLAFDTQLFRYIRNSPNTHRIAAELLEFPIDATLIHRSMFGNQTVNKMAFLAKALGQIEYYSEGRFALVRLKDADFFHYNLEPEDSRDVIDMIMNIESLEAAALFREDGENQFKISFRSKGLFEVLPVAEIFGGGGHVYAAGTYIEGEFEDLKARVIAEMVSRLENHAREKIEKN